MIRLTIGVLLLCMAGCSRPQEPRLIGTWQSDKGATLEILTKYRELTPKQLENVGAIFGKLTVTYDKRTANAKLDDWNYTSRYKVLARNETCAVIESPDLLFKGQDRFDIIQFEGRDRYLLHSQYLNFPEVFKRIR